MKTIQRKKYLDYIQKFVGKPLIKILAGQRRVGKTILLQQVIDLIKQSDSEANIIYIDKDNLEFDNIRNYKDLDDFIKLHSSTKNNYILIDEVQEISGFEKVLRSYIAKPNYDIYITGNNASLLSSDLATLLTGRHITIRVFPLSFNEFLQLNELQPTAESLMTYLRFGGMPFLAHLQGDDRLIFDYLDNLLGTILFKDVIKRYQIRDVDFLSRLTQYLASITGHIFSVNKIANYLKSKGIKKSQNTIVEYLDYLENAFVINKAQRYNIVGKGIFSSGVKYYFEDLGIRNVIRGYVAEEFEKIMENAVYNHLRYLGYKVFVGQWYDREIDFVAINSENDKIYIQVAWKIEQIETLQREISSLLKIKDNFPKILITTENYLPQLSETGIKHFSLLEFLQIEKLSVY